MRKRYENAEDDPIHNYLALEKNNPAAAAAACGGVEVDDGGVVGVVVVVAAGRVDAAAAAAVAVEVVVDDGAGDCGWEREGDVAAAAAVTAAAVAGVSEERCPWTSPDAAEAVAEDLRTSSSEGWDHWRSFVVVAAAASVAGEVVGRRTFGIAPAPAQTQQEQHLAWAQQSTDVMLLSVVSR